MCMGRKVLPRELSWDGRGTKIFVIYGRGKLDFGGFAWKKEKKKTKLELSSW
jgi:hypothetical protein